MKSFSIIVVTIVFSTLLNQSSITTEARQLKKTGGQDDLKAGSTDAFVPTSPGNSPGVGHKKGNAYVDQGFQDDLKHTEGRRLEKTNGPNYFKTGSKDDFAPTTPGNSPGIGHKKVNENVIESNKNDFKPKEERRLKKTNGQDYSKTGSTDDFAPTNPGNSPGIGHKKGNANVKESKGDFEPTEDRRPKKTNDKNYSKTGSTDDFAPTTPGNSPGMGHKKGDEFKPTTPGHSPGVGHTINNNEPKA